MFHYEASVVIRRLLGEVFAYMNDIHREHEWQPYIRAVEHPAERERGGRDVVFDPHVAGFSRCRG